MITFYWFMTAQTQSPGIYELCWIKEKGGIGSKHLVKTAFI
jgi:hypothetical protein